MNPRAVKIFKLSRCVAVLAPLGCLAAATPGLADAPPAAAESAGAELAKKLSNPVANLISVPFKLDWDTGAGPANADRTTLYMQPVIPVSISRDWNLIVRTIVPITWAQSPTPGGSDASGLGDTLQEIFLSPKAPTSSGIVWGVGPVLLYPTASQRDLGSGKWGAGPTFVVLRQSHGWTTGLLVYQLWSYAGQGSRQGVSQMFVQPFITYGTKGGTTFALNTESAYDWRSRQWTVPINATVSQLVRLGKRPVQLQVGARYYADTPAGGPDWGLRTQVTLLFPER